jgi:DNA primase
VIEFVKLARKCSFTDAVRFLNDLPVAPSPDQETQLQTRLFNDRIQKPRPSEFDDVYQCFFDLLSPLTEEAYGWLENRSISKKTADKMHVRWLLKRHRVEEKLKELSPVESLIASGLMGENGTLLLDRHRLIWTYFRNNKPVYFQGRALDAKVQPKEMCLKQAIPCPYNIDILKTKPSVVLVCEGCVDTLTLVEHGLPAVGVVGVNGFKESWLELFRGIRVRVAFDADLAGQSRAFELVQRFRAFGIESEKVYLPDGYDVNRFFIAYRQFVANGW